MTVRQTIIAGVRTGVQRLVAVAVGALAAYLASKGLDVQLDSGALTLFLDVAITGAVTSGLIALEKRFTWLTAILSLGTTKSTPEYA